MFIARQIQLIQCEFTLPPQSRWNMARNVFEFLERFWLLLQTRFSVSYPKIITSCSCTKPTQRYTGHYRAVLEQVASMGFSTIRPTARKEKRNLFRLSGIYSFSFYFRDETCEARIPICFALERKWSKAAGASFGYTCTATQRDEGGEMGEKENERKIENKIRDIFVWLLKRLFAFDQN